MCYSKIRNDPKETLRAALHAAIDGFIDDTKFPSGSNKKSPQVQAPVLPEMKAEFQSILQSYLSSAREGESPVPGTAGNEEQSKQEEAGERPENESAVNEHSFCERLKTFFTKLLDVLKQVVVVLETICSWFKSFLQLFT